MVKNEGGPKTPTPVEHGEDFVFDFGPFKKYFDSSFKLTEDFFRPLTPEKAILAVLLYCRKVTSTKQIPSAVTFLQGCSNVCMSDEGDDGVIRTRLNRFVPESSAKDSLQKLVCMAPILSDAEKTYLLLIIDQAENRASMLKDRLKSTKETSPPSKQAALRGVGNDHIVGLIIQHGGITSAVVDTLRDKSKTSDLTKRDIQNYATADAYTVEDFVRKHASPKAFATFEANRRKRTSRPFVQREAPLRAALLERVRAAVVNESVRMQCELIVQQCNAMLLPAGVNVSTQRFNMFPWVQIAVHRDIQSGAESFAININLAQATVRSEGAKACALMNVFQEISEDKFTRPGTITLFERDSSIGRPVNPLLRT